MVNKIVVVDKIVHLGHPPCHCRGPLYRYERCVTSGGLARTHVSDKALADALVSSLAADSRVWSERGLAMYISRHQLFVVLGAFI